MTGQAQFTAFSRFLHWLMAVMVLAMLFIGAGMVSSVSERYHLLVSIHRPLGILILVLVIVRIVNRCINPAPPLPAQLPLWQRLAAKGSHVVLYALMFLLPLVGWAMLSAARYPIVLYGPLHLPPILSHDAKLYAVLRQAHTYLAYLLFATFLAHLGAALLHALIHRDGVFTSMAPWRTRAGEAASAKAGDAAAGPASI
jgi:cytochrome b561